jgi:hypothetical protein
MGSSRAAFCAGKKPKITPTATENRKAITTMLMLEIKGTCMICASQTDADTAGTMPNKPPNEDSTTASTRKCRCSFLYAHEIYQQRQSGTDVSGCHLRHGTVGFAYRHRNGNGDFIFQCPDMLFDAAGRCVLTFF